MKTEDRHKKLQEENQHLVDRWLRKMNEEAEKMNEVNAMYKEIMQASKQIELQRKIDDDVRKQSIASAINDSINTPSSSKLELYDF